MQQYEGEAEPSLPSCTDRQSAGERKETRCEGT
jgi:hypothetical protein